jgi:hypothetical protein
VKLDYFQQVLFYIINEYFFLDKIEVFATLNVFKKLNTSGIDEFCLTLLQKRKHSYA